MSLWATGETYDERPNRNSLSSSFWKPCITGMGITAQDVLELLSEGLSFEQIVAHCYPELTDENIRTRM